MKRVLLLAYYFPPSVDAGAKRALGFFRHLPEHGYRPIVITPRAGNYVTAPGAEAPAEAEHVVRVIEERSLRRALRPAPARPEGDARGRGARALRRLYRELVDVPDAYRGFFAPARAAALAVARREPVAAVVAMSTPYTCLRLGASLGRDLGVPWIADLRDLWVDNHFGYPYSPARRLLDRFLERRWLGSAAAITCATEGLRQRLEEHRPGPMPIRRIYNGYLEETRRAAEEEAAAAGPAAPGRLRLVFTGKLYDAPGHSVAPLLDALGRLHRRRPDLASAIQADFYGVSNPDFFRQVELSGLGESVRHHGVVSREAAAREQARADVLVLLLPDTKAQEVTVAAKTSEYLSTGHPILAIAPPLGEAAQILRATRGGRVFAPSEVDAVATWLEEAALAKREEGHVAWASDRDAVRRFEFSVLAGELARVIDDARGPRAADPA